MAELRFLGSGSAFTLGDGNWQSNLLLTTNDNRRLLIDCGTDIRFSLGEQGLGAADLNAVYISHLHADHCGGLEWLGFSTAFGPGVKKRPRLFAATGVMAGLWDHALKGGMEWFGDRTADLTSYFDPVAVEAAFSWEGTVFRLVPAHHLSDGQRWMPCFGLAFALGGRKVLFTADSQFAPERLAPYYHDADLIFQDCETEAAPSGVHAHYRDLCGLPADIRAKMWLYHTQGGPHPDAAAAGFKGFVAKGQRFD